VLRVETSAEAATTSAIPARPRRRRRRGGWRSPAVSPASSAASLPTAAEEVAARVGGGGDLEARAAVRYSRDGLGREAYDPLLVRGFRGEVEEAPCVY
jgi:hypothetical protein